MYVMVNPKGKILPESLNHYRYKCISNFVSGSGIVWSDAREYGWKCEKVEVIINRI